MRLIFAWHKFAVKHFMQVNIIILLLSLFFLANLRDLPFDANWLSLFSENDQTFIDYQQLTQESNTTSSIFLKLTDCSKKQSKSFFAQIKSIEGVIFVKAINFESDSLDNQWWEIGLASDSKFSFDRQTDIVGTIESSLKNLDIQYGLTGAIPILREFNESVKEDFIKTSLFALTLIVLVIIISFGFSLSVVFGFVYQGVGLLAALFIFKQFYGVANTLAATLPCVLLGLGIDFVIHTIIAAKSSSRKGDYCPGEEIYRKVSVPIFCGAITTTLAFLSLSFVDLKGLHSAGVFGSLGVMGMFIFVMLFLPPVVTRFEEKNASREKKINMLLPFIKRRKSIGIILIIVVCTFFIYFVHQVKFEDRIENLYNKQMITLKLQDELTSKLGLYPSKLFISFESRIPKKNLKSLFQTKRVFLPNSESIKIDPLMNPNYSKVGLQILARKNPFALENFQELYSQIKESLGSRTSQTLRISGDAVLYHHLNNLLIKGMMSAFLVVFLILALVLFVLFRKIRFIFSTLLVLAVSTFATLGGFGLFSISLSVYTITLFPLFIGIGIDDCLHIAYLKSNGERLSSSSFVLKAITLTTVTTLLCYGSLIIAKNAGFVSMGKAAILGLSLIFLCTIYLLPVLLDTRVVRKPREGIVEGMRR